METNYPSRSNRTATIVIALVLLLHLLLLAFLLIWQHHDKNYELKLAQLHEQLIKQMQAQKQQQQLENPDQEQTEWFSGAARPSAPVIFHDEPTTVEKTETTQIPETIAKEMHQSVLQEKVEPQAEQSQEETEESNTTELKKDQEIKPEMQTTLEHSADHIQEKGQPHSLTTTEEQKKEEATKQIKQHIKKKNEKEKTELNTNASQPAVKNLALSDIAQGLMQKMQENSQHYVETRGGREGQPTAEQLKYERYIAKLFACIQKSIRIHKHNLQIQVYQEAEVDFQLTLNRNGSLANLRLIRSSGVRQLDDFILFVVQDAASSFPPVPSYLKQTSYPLGFILNPTPNKPLFNLSFI